MAPLQPLSTVTSIHLSLASRIPACSLSPASWQPRSPVCSSIAWPTFVPLTSPQASDANSHKRLESIKCSLYDLWTRPNSKHCSGELSSITHHYFVVDFSLNWTAKISTLTGWGLKEGFFFGLETWQAICFWIVLLCLLILGHTTQSRWQSGRLTLVTAATKDCLLSSSTPTFTTWTASSQLPAPWRWAQWLPRTLPCWLTTAGTDRRTWWTREI